MVAVAYSDGMDDEDVRLAVYESFSRTGRPPAVTDLGMAVDAARSALSRLADARHIVLNSRGDIVMAHPFSAVPLGFSVMGRDVLWWGGCAWDSFAIPHLLPDQSEVLVATRCQGCGRPHAWSVGVGQPPPGDQVAHLLTPTARMWDDVVHTCDNQRIFCSQGCITEWLNRTGQEQGYVMDLPTLWRLSAGWYAGRLDRGYVRREPVEALVYLREAGLRGSFWGLPE